MNLSGYTELERALDILSSEFYRRIMTKPFLSSEEAMEHFHETVKATRNEIEAIVTHPITNADIQRVRWHHRCQELKEHARSNRRRPSKYEYILRKEFKRNSKGHVFWWQGIILPYYIVDFVCYRCKLIIEIDGAEHDKKQHWDWMRSKWLSRRGFRIRRFTNQSVLDDPSNIVKSLLPCP